MEVSHIEHLGIAVKSLDTAIPFWEKMLGTKCYNIEEVPSQKVKTAFFKVNIEERLSECEAAGIQLIDKAPRGGAEGLSIAFLHPKSTGGVLTELCEDKNEK